MMERTPRERARLVVTSQERSLNVYAWRTDAGTFMLEQGADVIALDADQLGPFIDALIAIEAGVDEGSRHREH